MSYGTHRDDVGDVAHREACVYHVSHHAGSTIMLSVPVPRVLLAV